MKCSPCPAVICVWCLWRAERLIAKTVYLRSIPIYSPSICERVPQNKPVNYKRLECLPTVCLYIFFPIYVKVYVHHVTVWLRVCSCLCLSAWDKIPPFSHTFSVVTLSLSPSLASASPPTICFSLNKPLSPTPTSTYLPLSVLFLNPLSLTIPLSSFRPSSFCLSNPFDTIGCLKNTEA